MKATISPPTHRTVTLEMSEEDARYLKTFFSKLSETEVSSKVGTSTPRQNDKGFTYRLYFALADCLGD
jgi:hypothetical protein